MTFDIEAIANKYQSLSAHLDERGRRLWAAAEAAALGYGGVSAVSRATGICRRVIHLGMEELRRGETLAPNRIRRPGGGRKLAAHHYASLPSELEKLLEPLTRGDFDSPLRWTCKSVTLLTEELSAAGFRLGRQTVATELHKLGCRLQNNRKTPEGRRCPDREAQFEHINAQVSMSLQKGEPVIAVETGEMKAAERGRDEGMETAGKNKLVNIGL